MTPDIRVLVQVQYAPGHSGPGRHVFIYHIRIENHAEESYQLIEREWQIHDGNGQVTQVQGEGVVGEQPLLKPRGVFEYNSFTSLTTPPGRMSGAYTFRDAWGERYRVPIEVFTLAVPEARTLN